MRVYTDRSTEEAREEWTTFVEEVKRFSIPLCGPEDTKEAQAADYALQVIDRAESRLRVVLKERDEECKDRVKAQEAAVELAWQLAEVKVNLLRAEEALQAYADEKMWSVRYGESRGVFLNADGNGEMPWSIARAALSPKGQPK